MEEVKPEWALGQVAVEEEEGRENQQTDAPAGENGRRLQTGRKEQGTAISSDAPALTRSKNSSSEIGPHRRPLRGEFP